VVFQFPAEKLSPAEVRRGVEVCLAASTFGDYDNKIAAVRAAERLLSSIPTPQPPDLKIVVEAHRQKLSLWAGESIAEHIRSLQPASGRKENAYLGEVRLIWAQQLAEDGNISHAWELLQQWAPCNAAQPSGLESVISSRIDFMKGKLSRFRGDFEEARLYLEPLTNQYPAPRIQFSSTLQLAAVYGELGLWEKAREVLNFDPTTDKRRRLLLLTKAELDLSQGLAGSDIHLKSANNAFQNLCDEYRKLVQTGRGSRRNFFRICIGLAMILHVQHRKDSLFSALLVLNCWKLAYDACRQCLVTTEGFPDMICLLSIADIKQSMSDTSSDYDLLHAQNIWEEIIKKRSEQRFFFTNLGTRWLNLVLKWLEEAGKIVSLPGLK